MIKINTYKYKDLLAHYDKDDTHKKQFLIEHMLEVSKISRNLGKKIELKSCSEIIGLLHDFGKSSEKFQLYIKDRYRGKVNHSSAGAKILDYISNEVKNKYDIDFLIEDEKVKVSVWNLYKEVLQYPILAHHGLYDIIDNNFNYRTEIRLDYDKEKEYDFNGEGLKFFEFLNKEYIKIKEKDIYEIYYEGFIEFIKTYKKFKKMALKFSEKKYKNKALNFYYGTLVRLLLSILKEADIYDSSNYYRDSKDNVYSKDELNYIWNDMEKSVEDLYSSFKEKSNKSQLDIIRTSLADEIHNFSQINSKGVYKLSMPVGSGKTYASLRYSITNAKKFNKSRIFYCTAFLSVLEQNADSINEVLGEKYILEHHSNVVENFESDGDKEDYKEYLVNEYLKESWESPVVLTTLVQLSNTMFKHKASNIRRFSKLIDSVIIIDEIQSLPTKVIYNFNLMTNFLTEIMNCNILHCTATQPNLDDKVSLRYPCFYGNNYDKVSVINSIKNAEVFDRVDYFNLLGDKLDKTLATKEVVNHINEQFKTENSALVVLNTKKAVSILYEELKNNSEIQGSDCEVIYLTTNQCPAHRLEIIKKMKEQLKKIRSNEENRKIICVSTKLVEAGVDIDFDIVYRSITGIDSIIQCGGRCNREGKKDTNGKLFIFNYEEESLRYLKDLEKQREAAITSLKKLIREDGNKENINIEKALEYYFFKLYSNEEVNGKHLEYPISTKDTILDLLTTNPVGINNYKIEHDIPYFKLRQAFKTAAIKFDLIKEDTVSVIVQYKNNELLESLYNAIDCKEYFDIKGILKKLQPYTISIRRIEEYEKYISKELDGEIFILNREAYDENRGLIKGELEVLIC